MRKLVALAFLLAIGSSELSQAQAPEITLAISRGDRGRTLSFSITPSASASGCTYQLFGAGKKRTLNGTLPEESLLTSKQAEEGTTTLVAQNLRSLRHKGAGSETQYQPIFFRAQVDCSGALAQSDLRRVILKRKARGIRNLAPWLVHLRNRLFAGTLQLVQVFENLTFSTPLDLQNAGDGSNRLFVVQQGGIVFAIDPDTHAKTAFLDISDRVGQEGEQGLLGLAFHPDFASNGYLFVNYTDINTGNTVIARYQVTGDPNNVDESTETILFTVTQPFENHNGGGLAFGPDGYLYIGLGDGGSGGDPEGNGQDRTTLLGKMLRIDVDSTTLGNYGVPGTNPFVGNAEGFREEIFAYGLRNPFRFSFDQSTGKLWCGDVGQGSREEIDVITNGANMGWNTMEGDQCYEPSSGCDRTGLTLPIAAYDNDGGAAVTGGYVYRGSEIPNLAGYYIYGDFEKGIIWTFAENDLSPTPIELFRTDHLISSFGTDEAGELYLLSYGDGTIFKFSN